MPNYKKTFIEYDKSLSKQQEELSGTLGITLGGQKVVEVPNRPGFVYVQLRNNSNEIIQAHNDAVSTIYGLPVLLIRQGNTYKIKGRDVARYGNNWNTDSSFLPKHANQHSFNPEGAGGGDVVWVYGKQMMPMLAFPSGTYGSSEVLISPYQYLQADGTILNIGLASTGNMIQHKPTDNQAIMGLVYVDTVTGNPGFIINSGTPFAESITGTFAVAPYIPAMTDPDNLLVAGIRLVSGTTSIGWDNIYDLRQWFTLPPTGSSSGISDHESLTGLLGGSSNNHWHLTPSQLSGLASGTVTSLHLHATGTILHNSLTDLQGGTAGNYWHLNSAQIIGLVSGTSTSLHNHAPYNSSGFTGTFWLDLTDGGVTTLHSHTGTGAVYLVMETGVTFPPVPLTNAEGTDWIYST